MKFTLLIFVGSFILRISPLQSQTTSVDIFNFPAGDTTFSKKIACWGTQYFVHEINKSGKVPFLDPKGKALGFWADTCDFCEAALEGTAHVKDVQGHAAVLNFETYGDSAVVDCRKCKRFAHSKLPAEKWGFKRWFISSGFGNGVKGYRLIPYRTIAVDPKYIPYGTVIYIPRARGVSIILPDGTKISHDGYFFAGDTGSAIIGQHIDFFTGISKYNPFQSFVKSSDKTSFTAYMVKDAAVINALNTYHIQK